MKDKVLSYACQVQKENPRWRWGQTIFNVAYDLFPDVANKLRGTQYDCFWDDSKVDDFLDHLE